MDTAVSVELFVEILNRYVYYFDQQNDAVSIHQFDIIIMDLLTQLDYHQIPQWPN